MHNVRLLTCRLLSDMCRSQNSLNNKEFDSGRLYMNLSLYRRGLTGLILLVDREINYHIENKTGLSLISSFLINEFLK